MDAAPPTCQGVCMSVQKQFQCVCNRFYKIIVHPSNTNLSLPSLLSAVQCPAHDVRYDSSGVILSPGWPESYPNLQMCSWSVTVEKGYNVTITFESFHTEREFDVLEIFDGKKSLKELHSPKHNTDTQCRKNSAKKCCSFCFFLITHTHTHTHTHSDTLSSSKVIKVFSSFPLPLSWSLSGSTPNSQILATLSGDLPTPFNITTSGHQFLVRWSSDHGTNKKGFKIRYVGEYQSMYPNFTLLLLYILILHGYKDRSRQRQTERQRDKSSKLCWQIDRNLFNVYEICRENRERWRKCIKKKKFFLTFCSLSDLASVCLLKQFPLLRYGVSFELLSFKLGLMSTAAVLQQSLLYISTVLHLGLLSITWDCWALSTWVMSLECFIQGHSLTFKEKGRLLPV